MIDFLGIWRAQTARRLWVRLGLFLHHWNVIAAARFCERRADRWAALSARLLEITK